MPRATDRLPGVYEVNLMNRRPARRIIPDATEPTVSPDGRWIAAFATKGAKRGEMWPFRRQLTLYPRAGGAAVPLSANDGGRGIAICWSPDSRRIAIFAERYNPTRLAISTYTLANRRETALTAIKNEGLADPVTAIHGVAPLGTTRDGRTMYLLRHGEKESAPHTGFRALDVLDLNTAAIQTAYQVDGYGALAWRETNP